MSTPIDWSMIDTVLLDMDGTLLDLKFDNWFWLDFVPSRYAAAKEISIAAARIEIEPKFRAVQGTLPWYCIDHWSRELDLDIALLKREMEARRQVGYLPGAEKFLKQLKLMGKRRVLVTNSHPTTLEIKNEEVGLKAHFNACYSTHEFSVPKEHEQFWPRFNAAEQFAAARTLFVDDSVPVLDAAQAFGIGWLRAIRRPDSGRPPQATGRHKAVDQVADLIE